MTLSSHICVGQADSATDLNSSGKRLRNQFNFSERGIQTSFFPPRERGTSTEIPETVEASGACSQWEVFDAYVADQRQQRQQVSLLRNGLQNVGHIPLMSSEVSVCKVFAASVPNV